MTNIYGFYSIMLRRVRRMLAVAAAVIVTFLFLDFTGTLHAWLGWMAKIQFLPAFLALHVGIVIALVLLTVLLGRVYCSVICPLGVFQDFIAWLSKKRRRKNRYSFSPAVSWLRYSVLALFVLAMLGGVGSFVALLEPYSAYGRIVSNLFAPVYQWGNNGLAYLAERADSYAFYETDVWVRSWLVFGVAAVTLVVIVLLAWRNGRTYCNTVCPVGTLLGFFSRYSLFRPVIRAEGCVSCSLCARQCKASCIDYKNHKIDYSRCVACMDCLDACKHDAIRFGNRLKEAGTKDIHDTADDGVDPTRRKFFSLVALLTAGMTLKAQEKKVDGGLAVIEDKKVPERAMAIVPPGAVSARHFAQHCTGCQLCVSVCENQVLRPSMDWQKLMQPEMSYERGYCRPECTKCADVCPAGAIRPITVAEKSAIQIGHAVWVKANCIPLTDGVSCGNCARHCPAGAIQMVNSVPGDGHSLKIPVVNEERCIGCGACENLCPARPFSAIYVEGHEVHRVL